MKHGDLMHDLYTTRILVFFETEPQSNKYKQLILNGEEFKRVSDAITVGKQVGEREGDIQSFEINLSDEIYILPDLRDTQ